MANGLSPADGDAWGADWVDGSTSSQQQPGLLDQLVHLLAGHVGNALGGGVTAGGGGGDYVDVPGTGFIRGHDGRIYPNRALRGSDGRLYVSTPGTDLQLIDRLLAQPQPPPAGSYPGATDLFGYGPPIVRLGDQPGSVNVPNPTPSALPSFLVDPSLVPPGSHDVMPGATSSLDNYTRGYNWYRKPYEGNALLNQQTYADAYRQATGAEPPASR